MKYRSYNNDLKQEFLSCKMLVEVYILKCKIIVMEHKIGPSLFYF
jgi:hypothetical protein